ncbi:MAG TPA: ABC transporter substrate-binding protein [Actinomycetales bacterium]|jgi:osmoprotectant transport system substrate-binding protein
MRSSSRNPARRIRLAAAGLSLLALTACGGGGGDAFEAASEGASGTSSAPTQEVVVGAQGFTEAAIMQQMYVLLLQDAGFTTSTKTAERPILTESLKSGEVDVVPDYLGSTLNFVYNSVNSDNTEPVSTNDPQQNVAKFKEVGEPLGITALEPAQASDQNAFYVTKEFADANGGLTTLSELAALKQKLTLGADTFCGADTQPYCINGLKGTYGLDLTLEDSYQFGSPKLRDDVLKGVVDIGETGTTDGTMEPNGLVILQDDKKLQPAENLTPFINTKEAGDPKIAEALNKLAPVLTTEDLTGLNAKVDAERQKPEDVAKVYLVSKSLIKG